MKILMTGVSGLLGINAAPLLRRDHAVAGGYFQHALQSPGVRTERVDLGQPADVFRWMERERPDLVWHCAGLTNVDECEAHPDLAHALNVGAAETVARAAEASNAALIHVSTDHLFGGLDQLYREDTPPAPLNVYAATKAEAEQRVQAAHSAPLLIRTNFFGWGPPHRQSFSDWIVNSLERSERIRMFTDVYFTPILINDLVDTTMELWAVGARGILNVCGSERLSKFEFGCRLASTFGFDGSLIAPESVSRFPFRAPRPSDMSLDTSRAAGFLGRPLPDGSQSLRRLAEVRPHVPGSSAAPGAKPTD